MMKNKMKSNMRFVQALLLNLCVVCSLASMVAMVLDWFNPFMDFSGHMTAVRIVLYLAVIVLAITKLRA